MRLVRWLIIAVAAAVVLTTWQPARAVPAYARREGVMCQMCHFRPPELNEDGDAYLRRGLREAATAQTAVAPGILGQPTAIKWENYLSVIGEEALVSGEGEEGATFDAGAVNLLISGPFDPHWSALAHTAFNVEEGGTEAEDVYGMYISRWCPRYASGRFGQVLPFAILLNQGDFTLPLSTPLVLSVPTQAGTGWTPTTPLRAIEFGAVDTPKWNAYLGAAQPHFEEGFEGDRHTDIYASAEYLFTPKGDSITGYGYWGAVEFPPDDEDREFHRIGVFGNAYPSIRSKVVAGFLTGSDEAIDGSDLDTSGFFLLGEYLFTDQWSGYARWDWLKQDQLVGGDETFDGPAIGASYWLMTHVWLTGEAQFLNEEEETGGHRFTLQLTWTF